MHLHADDISEALALAGIHTGPNYDGKRRELSRALADLYDLERFDALLTFAIRKLEQTSGTRNPAAVMAQILHEKVDAGEGEITRLDAYEAKMPKPEIAPGEGERKRNMETKQRARDEDEKEEPKFYRARISRELWALVVGDQKAVEDVAGRYNLTKDEAIDLLEEEVVKRLPPEEEVVKMRKKKEWPLPRYESKDHRTALVSAFRAKWDAKAKKTWRASMRKHGKARKVASDG